MADGDQHIVSSVGFHRRVSGLPPHLRVPPSSFNTYPRLRQYPAAARSLRAHILIFSAVLFSIFSNHLTMPESMDMSSDSSASYPIYSNESVVKSNSEDEKEPSNPAQRDICAFCGVRLHSHTYMARHIRSIHDSSSSLPKFICHICGARFTRKSNLYRHINFRHGLNGRERCKML